MTAVDKIVIIINGTGGVGKDTLCELAAKQFRVENISAIEPIKEIALKYGWNGEKDSKARKFLSDLKRVFTEYNDMPTQYLYGRYQQFLKSNNQILFVHIREQSEIVKFRSLVQITCTTLLVDRKLENVEGWGNASDDEVKEFSYDYCYMNDKPLNEVEDDFNRFLQQLLDDRDK